MHGWQLVTILLVVGISQLVMALSYYRPREFDQSKAKARSIWKMTLLASIIAIVGGIILLLIPENLWWTH